MSAMEVNPKKPPCTKRDPKIVATIQIRDAQSPQDEVQRLSPGIVGGSQTPISLLPWDDPVPGSIGRSTPAQRTFHLLERRFEVRVLADFTVTDAIRQIPDRGDRCLDTDPPPQLDALDIVK